jgi:septal ring factor EnvC (AmiA/AmiB activator)
MAALFGVSLETLIGAGSGQDAETLDAEIEKTEAQLTEAANQHQDIWRQLGDIEASQAELQAERDAMAARVAFLQATLDSLRRARGRL